MSQIDGEIAALSAAFMWSLSSVLFTRVGKRIGPLNLNALRITVSAFLFSVTHFLLTGSFFPEVNKMQVAVLSLSGIIGLAIGDLAYFGSLLDIGPRKAILVSSMAPIFSLLGGFWILDEIPSFMALIGIFLVLLGIGIVIIEKREKEDTGGKHVLRGVLLGIVAAAGQGMGVVLSKYGMLFAGSPISPLSTTIIRVLAALPVIWLTVLIVKSPKHVYSALRDRYAVKMVILVSIIGPYIGLWLSMIAIKYAQVGIASTLLSTTPLMVLPVVYFMDKERINIRGVFGAVIAVIGIALIFLF